MLGKLIPRKENVYVVIGTSVLSVASFLRKLE